MKAATQKPGLAPGSQAMAVMMLDENGYGRCPLCHQEFSDIVVANMRGVCTNPVCQARIAVEVVRVEAV